MEDKTQLGYEIIEHLEYEIGSLALSYFASIERLNKIIEAPVKKAEETGYWNKWESKEIWGASFQYATFLHEMSILGIAKATEDVKVLLKRKLNVKFHPWDQKLKVPYLSNLKSCWALSNIIKHNQSILSRGASPYVDFILDEWKIPEGHDLQAAILAKHPMFEIVEHLPKVYLALCSLIYTNSGAKSHFHSEDWLQMVDDFYRYLIPEITDIKIPRFGNAGNR